MSVRLFFEFLHKWRVQVQCAFVVLLTLGYVWLDTYGTKALLDRFENMALDERVWFRGNRREPVTTVIIGVDESSFPIAQPWSAADLAKAPELAYMTPDWPWSRLLWGKLTERLINAGAKFVAFDFVFRAAMPDDLDCGLIFEKYANKIELASQLGDPKETALAGNGIREISGPSDDLLPSKGPEIVGLANVAKDDDGVERRMLHGYSRALLSNPALGDDPTKAAFIKPDEFTMTWQAANKVLDHPPDLDPAQPTLLNLYGKSRTITTLLIEDVLLNWDYYIKQGTFKDAVVFVGPLSEVRFKDSHATSMGLMAGVEIQATSFINLVAGDWLRPVPDWIAPATAVLFGLLALILNLRVQSVFGKVGLLLALILLFVAVTQWLFLTKLLVVPVGGATFGLIGCGGFVTMYDFVLERYERRRMLGVFESMVSPGVAGLVLNNRDDFEKRLGGQEKKLVVLFSDIRGFTTWSEKVGPEALVTQLNEYFLEMVGIIQEENGTVQKYIGDAMMAAWGDVREQPAEECAVSAVRAALRMKDALTRLNAGWLGQPKREQLGFGIGVNYGEGVVGRIGHPRRQEFTVMGDTVNVAARLESATKQYHQTFLFGESLCELAKHKYVFRLADKMQVKGKTFGVPVFVPMGERTAVPPPGLAEYEAAQAKFYARDFSGAAELFRAANAKLGGDDFLCENFLERCLHYQQEPPPVEWDGVWVLKEK